MAVKTVTKAQAVKLLSNMLDGVMSQGDRAAITRTIQILKGER